MLNEHDLDALEPGFRQWLLESEGYALRFERLFESFPLAPSQCNLLILWLYAAYQRGTHDRDTPPAMSV